MGFQGGGGDCSFSWGAAECARGRCWGVRGSWRGCEEPAGSVGAAEAAARPQGAAGGPGAD